MPSGSGWPGLLDEKTVSQLWRKNGMRPSVIKIYIATLYSFNAYCIHRKVNRVRELTADGADRFVRWYLSTRRIRSGAGNSSNALRAYSWALSTQGIQVPDWRIHKAEATPAIVARACPAFPDFFKFTGNQIGLRVNQVARCVLPEVKWSLDRVLRQARVDVGHGKAEASPELFTKMILSGALEYYFVGEQS